MNQTPTAKKLNWAEINSGKEEMNAEVSLFAAAWISGLSWIALTHSVSELETMPSFQQPPTNQSLFLEWIKLTEN